MAQINEQAGTPPQETVVSILDLQVILAPQGPGQWVAQALEFDYAAAGTDVEDVKQRFEDGLCATIHEHLKMYGDIKRLTSTPVSPALWMPLLKGQVSLQTYQQKSIHKFAPDKIEKVLQPFGQIRYMVVKPAA